MPRRECKLYRAFPWQFCGVDPTSAVGAEQCRISHVFVGAFCSDGRHDSESKSEFTSRNVVRPEANSECATRILTIMNIHASAYSHTLSPRVCALSTKASLSLGRRLKPDLELSFSKQIKQLTQKYLSLLTFCWKV